LGKPKHLGELGTRTKLGLWSIHTWALSTWASMSEFGTGTRLAFGKFSPRRD